MKALLFSDLHANYKQLSNLRTFLEDNCEIKLLIFAGDLVNMGEPVGFVEQFIEVVKASGAKLLWVPGNNDFGRSYFKLCKEFKSLEGKATKIGKYTFTGVGGSPASWAGQYAGESIINNESIIDSIFVSHIPLPGVHNYQKNDCSSPTSKKLSDSPIIHICGHDHFRWGCAYLGRTKIIKLAPAETGFYAIMDLDTLKVGFDYFSKSRTKYENRSSRIDS